MNSAKTDLGAGNTNRGKTYEKSCTVLDAYIFHLNNEHRKINDWL